MLVNWEDPEEWDGEGGGRQDLDGKKKEKKKKSPNFLSHRNICAIKLGNIVFHFFKTHFHKL